MNIRKVEEVTGISKQNIRFYEKHGLVRPQRNKENEYREYTDEDVRILKIVKILRKLDMPLEEIRKLLEEKIQLSEAIKGHQERLEKEEEKLQAAIAFCKVLENDTIDRMDADLRLREMEKEEERGNVFMSLMKDIVEIDKEEGIKRFSFQPNNPIANAKEFTEELLNYAKENNLDIVITKESIYPEFTLGGIEYEAHRFVSRLGAVVECNAKNIEQIETKEIPGTRRRILRFFVKVWPIILLGIVLFFSRIGDMKDTKNLVALLAAILIITVSWGTWMRFMPKS